MSLDYIETRIKDALKLHKGNVTRARQQVIAWTYEDTKLLHDLAKPHLTGIVAYHIERVVSGRSDRNPKVVPKPEQKQKKAPNKLGQADDFGLEILKAIAGNAGATFGLNGGAPPPRRGAASKSHIDALRQMAAKSKPRKK